VEFSASWLANCVQVAAASHFIKRDHLYSIPLVFVATWWWIALLVSWRWIHWHRSVSVQFRPSVCWKWHLNICTLHSYGSFRASVTYGGAPHSLQYVFLESRHYWINPFIISSFIFQLWSQNRTKQPTNQPNKLKLASLYLKENTSLHSYKDQVGNTV